VPVTQNAPAPYAPAKAILDIVGRYRNKGLPAPVTAEVLGRIGVSDSLIPRTLQALKALDLITDDGKPTQTFETLRLAPEAEYEKSLNDWLVTAYADVLQFIDPDTADDTVLRDAFRSYSPIGQQPRRVTLFTGLFAAAGIGPQKTKGATVARRSKPSMSASNGGMQKRNPAPQKPRIQEQPTASLSPERPQSEPRGFEKDLLAKFPEFDPSWSEDLKASWFKGFQQFMAMAKGT